MHFKPKHRVIDPCHWEQAEHIAEAPMDAEVRSRLEQAEEKETPCRSEPMMRNQVDWNQTLGWCQDRRRVLSSRYLLL